MMGQLQERVRLIVEHKEANGRGGWTIREEDLGKRWASILPMTAREITQFEQLDKNIDVRILMRKDPAITTDAKLFHNEKQYRIDSILDHGRFSDFIEILAQGE